MITVNYNTELFVVLMAVYYVLNGLAYAMNSIWHEGKERTFTLGGVWDGLLMVALAVIPLFF